MYLDDHWALMMKKITLFLLTFLGVINSHATEITVLNMDDANEGFNDPVPFTATGGNHANTLGEARLTAFKYAAQILAEIIPSRLAITIEAHMQPLGGSISQATLGVAGPTTLAYDFINAPHDKTWYPIALANHLANKDLNLEEAEIIAVFNSDIDGERVFGSSHWYYGLDANPPSSHPDFVSVVLHELIHGLGFVSWVDPQSGEKREGMDDVFSLFLEHNDALDATPADFPSMSDAQRAVASVAAPHLHWSGEHVNRKAFGYLALGISTGKVEMHAPAILVEDSSLSHFSSHLFPYELMMPVYLAPNHNIGLAAQLLSDIGWGNEADLQLNLTTESETSVLGERVSFDLTLSNNGRDVAEGIALEIDFPENLEHPVISGDVHCEPSTKQQLTCRVEQLAAANHRQLRLQFEPQTVMSLAVAAVVNANVVDPHSANNRARAVARVNANNVSEATNSASGGSGAFAFLGMLGILLFLSRLFNKRISIYALHIKNLKD